MNILANVAVRSFYPEIVVFLFLFLCVVTLVFLIDGFKNIMEYSTFGKILVVASVLPLIGLIYYEISLGYWLDATTSIDGYFVEQYLGADQDNVFLITTCLMNVLAKSYPKR